MYGHVTNNKLIYILIDMVDGLIIYRIQNEIQIIQSKVRDKFMKISSKLL